MKTEDQLKEDLILKEHNIPTYQEVEEMFESGENKVGLVQATGTGKSFIALQWLFDNCLMKKDKNILYLTSSKPIIGNFEASMKKVGIDKEVAFPNLDTEIYQSILQKDFDINKKYDYIILDEFHRVGAEKWGEQVKAILKANPNAKVLGLSATPIRYLDEGRDMAEELFGKNVVSGVNLLEAVKQGILPKAEYVPVSYSYSGALDEMQKKVMKIREREKQAKFADWVSKAKRRAEEAEGLEDVFARKIQKKDGRLLLFCTDVEQYDSIKQEIKSGLFKKVNKDVYIYEISYKDSPEKVKKTIDAFKNDNSNALKIMLSVEMFNEGVHIDDLDGCAMFRKTFSPRLWLQQIGRVLSVGKDRDPIVFDIVNNYENLNTIREMFALDAKGMGLNGGLEDYFPFHIDEKSFDLTAYLTKLDALLSYYSRPDQQYLECAERYAQKYKNLRVEGEYIEEDTDIRLGRWLQKVRTKYNRDPKSCKQDVVEKLLALDPKVFEYTREAEVEERDRKILEGVKEFTEKQGKVTIPKRYKHGDFALGDQLMKIKKFLKSEDGTRKISKYSKELVDKIIAMNPKALSTKEDELQERNERIIEIAKKIVEKNGQIPFASNASKTATEEEKWFAIQISNLKANLVRDGMKVLPKLKEKNTGKYPQELIDEILRINPDAFKSKDELKAERDAETLRKVREFTAKNGQIPIPLNIDKSIDEEEAKFRTQISRIKSSIKRPENGYNPELIEEILKINPNALKTKDDERFEKNAEHLQWVKEFVKKYGQVPINGFGKQVNDQDAKQFEYFSKIKKYREEGKDLPHNAELIDAILEINPNAFKTREEQKLDRDAMILEWTKLYKEMYGTVPIPTKGSDELTAQENEFRRQFGRIKRFLSENKSFEKTGKRDTDKDLFSEEFIAKILEINPNALKTKEDVAEERAEFILEWVKKYADKYGQVPLPLTTAKLVDEDEKRFRIAVSNLKYKTQVDPEPYQELIERIKQINPNALKTRDEIIEENNQEFFEMVKKHVQKNGQVPLPTTTHKVTNPTEKTFRNKVTALKKELTGVTRLVNKSLIDDVLRLNPNAFKTVVEIKQERDAQIVRKVREFTEKNGAIPIPVDRRADMPEEERVFRGQISTIKKSIIDPKQGYSREIIDEILKINQNAFKTREEIREELDQKYLAMLIEFTAKNGEIALPISTSKTTDKDEIWFRNRTSDIKKAISGGFKKGQTQPKPEFIEKILKINPNALNTKDKTKSE